MEILIIEIVTLAFIAIYFFWLFTGNKPHFLKSLSEDKEEPQTILLIIASILFIILGYSIRKWVEYPNYLGPKFSIEDLGANVLFVIYAIGVIFIFTGFYNLAINFRDLIYTFFIEPKINTYKSKEMLLKLKEFNTFLDEEVGSVENIKRLNKEGILKYNKKEIFHFWLSSAIQRPYFINRLKKALFYFISCICFFIIAFYLYDRTLYFTLLNEGELKEFRFFESLQISFDSFVEMNNGDSSFRKYWLYLVKFSGFALIISAIYPIFKFLYQYWDLYYRSVINHDDPNYFFVRAKNSEENGDIKQAIQYWAQLKKNIGNENPVLGRIQNCDYPMEQLDKKKINLIISQLKTKI